MRAILATAVLVALAMSATPTLAADRTVQTREDRDPAALAEWIAEIQRAWIGLALPGGLVRWTPPLPTVEEQTVTEETVQQQDRRRRVILEDGAPF